MQNYLPKNLFEDYLEVKKKGIFTRVLNEKFYRASDIPLTYRQLNNLDNDNLLPDDRKEKDGWREFSLKEIVYLYLIAEFKKYGVKHEQLLNLKKVFFDKKTEDVAEASIGMVLQSYQINIAIAELYGTNEVCFFDGFSFLTHSLFKSFVYVNLNEVFNELWGKITGKKIDYVRFIDIIENRPSEREKAILDMVKDNKYDEIKIRKQKGKASLIKGISKLEKLTEKGLVEKLRSLEYGDINIKKRDGKVVNFSTEDIKKI